MIQLRDFDRSRIFNLGYYTWVEQQGISFADFEARRQQMWWSDIRSLVAKWDERINEFNQQTGQTGQTGMA